MIRFANGTPTAMWFSQHASGQAFTYAALEKKGKRPLSYSGNGTHANYAVKGSVCPLLCPSKASQSPANHQSLSPTANTTTQSPASTSTPASSSTTQTAASYGTPSSMPTLTLTTPAQRFSTHQARTSPSPGWNLMVGGAMINLPGSLRYSVRPSMWPGRMGRSSRC